jgi:hypothetical protein
VGLSCRSKGQPSIGFTADELDILKVCLMHFGIGKWGLILDTGLLPGKNVAQLSGQTQRLLGEQSLAAYTNQRLNVDRICADNALRSGLRKAGLLTWEGSAFPYIVSYNWLGTGLRLRHRG